MVCRRWPDGRTRTAGSNTDATTEPSRRSDQPLLGKRRGCVSSLGAARDAGRLPLVHALYVAATAGGAFASFGESGDSTVSQMRPFSHILLGSAMRFPRSTNPRHT